MGFFSSIGSAIGSAISAVGSALSGGLSMMVEGLTGIAATIGNGIKSICESVGSEALGIIGCIAVAILIPGFGIPEILGIIQCIAEVVKILDVNEGDDSPEELGMKAEIADKKPEDFDSIEEYIKYLNDEVKLEDNAAENLSETDRVKYGALGTALNIKAIEEKYDINLSPDFLRDITLMKLTGEEVAKCIDKCKENEIKDVQDMTDYLRGNSTQSDKSTVSEAIVESISEVYPELSKDEVEVKLCEMSDNLKDE